MNFLYHPSTIYYELLEEMEWHPIIRAGDKNNAFLKDRVLAVALRCLGTFGLLGMCTFNLSIWVFKTVTLVPMFWQGVDNHFLNLKRDFFCIGYAVALPFYHIHFREDRPLISLSEALSPERTASRKCMERLLCSYDEKTQKVWYDKMTVALQRRDGVNCPSLLHYLLKSKWYRLFNRITHCPSHFGVTTTQLSAVFHETIDAKKVSSIMLDKLFEGIGAPNLNNERFDLSHEPRIDTTAAKLMFVEDASLYSVTKEWIDSKRGTPGWPDVPYNEWDKFFKYLGFCSKALLLQGKLYEFRQEPRAKTLSLEIDHLILERVQNWIQGIYPQQTILGQWLKQLLATARLIPNDHTGTRLHSLQYCATLWHKVSEEWQNQGRESEQDAKEAAEQMDPGLPNDSQMRNITLDLNSIFSRLGLTMPTTLAALPSPAA